MDILSNRSAHLELTTYLPCTLLNSISNLIRSARFNLKPVEPLWPWTLKRREHYLLKICNLKLFDIALFE